MKDFLSKLLVWLFILYLAGVFANYSLSIEFWTDTSRGMVAFAFVIGALLLALHQDLRKNIHK